MNIQTNRFLVYAGIFSKKPILIAVFNNKVAAIGMAKYQVSYFDQVEVLNCLDNTSIWRSKRTNINDPKSGLG